MYNQSIRLSFRENKKISLYEKEKRMKTGEVAKRFSKDPKTIRSWEGSKMPGFGPETFSDEDIANIVAYLKQMASEKL